MEGYIGKKIIITGGRGYIGSKLSNYFSSLNCELIIIDNSNHKWMPSGEKAKVIYKAINLEDEVAMSNTNIFENCDYIFHFASQEIDYKKNIKEDYNINSFATYNLLNKCKNLLSKPKIIYSSAAMIYGLTNKLPVNEKHNNSPPSIWAIHKLISEMYLKYFHEVCGMKTLSLRLSNIYGPTDRLEIFSRVVLNKISIKAYNDQQIHIFNNSKCKRDFIYIDDVINAFLFTIFLTDKSFKGNHFVIGSGETTTFNDLSIKLKNKKENIKITKDEKTQMHLAEYRDFVADSSLFTSQTNWKSKVKLDEGLNRTLDFIKNNNDQLK